MHFGNGKSSNLIEGMTLQMCWLHCHVELNTDRLSTGSLSNSGLARLNNKANCFFNKSRLHFCWCFLENLTWRNHLSSSALNVNYWKGNEKKRKPVKVNSGLLWHSFIEQFSLQVLADLKKKSFICLLLEVGIKYLTSSLMIARLSPFAVELEKECHERGAEVSPPSCVLRCCASVAQLSYIYWLVPFQNLCY